MTHPVNHGGRLDELKKHRKHDEEVKATVSLKKESRECNCNCAGKCGGKSCKCVKSHNELAIDTATRLEMLEVEDAEQ